MNKRGFNPHSPAMPAIRLRIRTAQIVRRLQEHVLGAKLADGTTQYSTLTLTQLRAAEILLRKTLPDLASVEHTGELLRREPNELPDAVLEHIAAGGSASPALPAPSPEEPGELH